MIEFISVLKAGTEAISLTKALAEIVKASRSQGTNSPLAEIMGKLQLDAVRLSRDLENRLRIVRDSLQQAGVDLNASIETNLRKLDWYNFVTRYRLKQLREELSAIARQFTGFLDDVTAVLICKQMTTLAQEPFVQAFHAKRRLDERVSDATASVGRIIDVLLDAAGQVSAELMS